MRRVDHSSPGIHNDLGFVFDLLSGFVAHCCSVLSLLPIKDGLHDGRVVQVS